MRFERSAFALWQQDGRLSVIADDGAVLEPYMSRRFVSLPLVVGKGADIAGHVLAVGTLAPIVGASLEIVDANSVVVGGAAAGAVQKGSAAFMNCSSFTSSSSAVARVSSLVEGSNR